MALLKSEPDSILHLAGESTCLRGHPECLSGISGSTLFEQALDKRDQCFSNFGVHMNYLGIWLNAHSESDISKHFPDATATAGPHRHYSEYQWSRQDVFWTLPLTLFSVFLFSKAPSQLLHLLLAILQQPTQACLTGTGPAQFLITFCVIPIGTCPQQVATLQKKASQLTHMK